MSKGMIEHWEWVLEMHDIAKVQKLEKLTNPETFWDDVRKLTNYPMTDHNCNRWEHLAEMRANEIGA